MGDIKKHPQDLSDKSKLTTVKGRFKGAEVEGLAYQSMVLVTDDMCRYEVFVNFDPKPGQESPYY